MAANVTQQLLDLNQKLLVAIVGGDWKTATASVHGRLQLWIRL